MQLDAVDGVVQRLDVPVGKEDLAAVGGAVRARNVTFGPTLLRARALGPGRGSCAHVEPGHAAPGHVAGIAVEIQHAHARAMPAFSKSCRMNAL